MKYTVNLTYFAPPYEGAPLTSSYTFDDLDKALRSANQSACLSFSDAIEVIDETGTIHAQWTSLYNFMYHFKDGEAPDEYFDRNLAIVIQQIAKHFIPQLDTHMHGRTVSFVDGENKVISFTVIPGTESIFMDACMEAACKGEEAEEDGLIDFSVMKHLMAKYTDDLIRRQQRYEKQKQRELDRYLIRRF